MVHQIDGYAEIPEEDQKKAKVFFDRAATVASTGNFDYAIELYISGLELDPELVEAHQALRDVSLRRKASGGKPMGMIERMRLPRAKDERRTMLNAEKQLAYDPGNTDYMLQILQSAFKEGYYDTAIWIGSILYRAIIDSGKPDFAKFIALKDVYRGLKQWQLATDACQQALAIRPDDMDLQTELKNLGAQQTMEAGGYSGGKSFRDSVRDAEAQQRLLERDSGVVNEDILRRNIRESEAEYRKDPTEPGKVGRYVDALIRTDDLEYENRALEVLENAFEQTGQFRFRLRIGEIKRKQLARMERSMRAELAKTPDDETLKKDYLDFLTYKAETELAEYELAAEAYPTDLGFKYEIALRLFELKRYTEAIPRFQEAMSDPKVRSDARVLLGRSFLEAEFLDEACDTLRVAIEEYPVKGDSRSKEMYYWYGRALEAAGDNTAAAKCYSQVAQWDFGYKDVQSRIKSLRGK